MTESGLLAHKVSAREETYGLDTASDDLISSQLNLPTKPLPFISLAATHKFIYLYAVLISIITVFFILSKRVKK